ncbi:MAG: TerB N-terminal domain-containing protein [Candidatus Thorarchaeota archaeon]
MSTTLTIVAENIRDKTQGIGDSPLVIPKRFENVFPVESTTVIIAYQGSSTPKKGDYISFQISSKSSLIQREHQYELFTQIDKIVSHEKILRYIPEEEIRSILQKSAKEIDFWTVASVLGYYSPRRKTILMSEDSLIGEIGEIPNLNSVIKFLNQYLECLFYTFPLKLVNYLVYNSTQGSKFCQRGNTKILEDLIPEILKKVNNHFLEVEKKNFLTMFSSQTDFSITQTTANINDIKQEFIDWLAPNKPMVDFFTDILKYTEKKLSLIVKYRGKVEVNPRPLPESIKNIVQKELKTYERRIQPKRELNRKQPVFAEFEIGFTSKKEVTISIREPEVKPLVRIYDRKPRSTETKVIISEPGEDVNELEAKMKLAAHSLDFKEASRIREKLEKLKKNIADIELEESPPTNLQTAPVENFTKAPKFVPFDQYWPTIDTMSEDQKNWYEYWVSEVENGHYYPTDLSYIFLQIYQALDYESEKGYRILRDLWIHYRREHPKLDRYLINWITDYILLNDCPYDQKTITRELIKFHSKYTVECLDSILTLFAPRFKEIPIEWINVLANNSIKSSSFYSSKPKVMNEIVPEVLDAIDRYYHETENVSLLEKFKPAKVARFVFDKALKNESYLMKTIEIYPYTKSPPFIVFIVEVVRTTETKLRKYYRFPALPHICILEREIENIIEITFTKYISELSLIEHETELSFIDAAQNYVNRVEDETKPVPLYQFQPNYQDMTKAQLKWYFYWRNQVRNGNFLATQIGYIILYIYEIINDIGIQDHQEGFKRLLAIWEYYRIDNPELDEYFPEWIVEYAILNQIPVDNLEELYHTILNRLDRREQRDLRYELTELLLSQYQGEAFSKIPIKMIYELVGYLNFLPYARLHDSVRRTIDQHVSKILNEVDIYYLQKYNKGLLEFYSPTKKRRIPFVLARYFGEIDTLEVKGYSRQLLNFLDNTIRFIHNRFRDIELDTTKTRLKVAIPDPEVEALIDYYFIDNLNATNIIPKYSKIALQVQSGDLDVDQSKIKALTEESDEIQTLLTTPDSFEFDQEEIIPEAGIVQEKIEEPINQSGVQEIEEWDKFHSRLTDFQLKVLRILATNKTPKEQLDFIADETGTLPETIIESINEIALEIIDDIVIESDLLTIIDEYLDKIKSILKI